MIQVAYIGAGGASNPDEQFPPVPQQVVYAGVTYNALPATVTMPNGSFVLPDDAASFLLRRPGWWWVGPDGLRRPSRGLAGWGFAGGASDGPGTGGPGGFR